MSHAATNWAIQQRGLKPTTKIVLWHLCDRFNPDYGCFPSQERLAQDCEISRSTLNTHLTLLERAGLIRRVQRVNPETRRQMPTRYILGFEPGFTQDHVFRVRKLDMVTTCRTTCPSWSGKTRSKSDLHLSMTSTRVRKPDAEPCPILSQSRVRKMTIPVSEIRTLTL